MMIPIAVAAFALLLAVVYLIARPFVSPLVYEAVATLAQLHADRDRLRAQLRELDMDFETGKLGSQDYERYRARRLQQIEATTRAIRDAQDEPRGGLPIGGDVDEELERRISVRKAALEALEAPTCRGCGSTIDRQDRFCRRCGADVTTAGTR